MDFSGSVNNKNAGHLHYHSLKINANIINDQTHKLQYAKIIVIVQLHGMIELIMYALKLDAVYNANAVKYLIIKQVHALYKDNNVPQGKYLIRILLNVKLLVKMAKPIIKKLKPVNHQ